MSQIYAPYGFRPVGVLGQEYNTNGFSEYPLITDNATAITVGDPVALIGGSITPTIAVPTATLGVNTPVGIAWGFTYIDAMGKIWETVYLPATSLSALGFTKVMVKLVDDDRALMYVSPNGALPANCVGLNAGYANFGTTKTQSTIALDVASVGTGATLPLRIIRIDRPDDAFPDVVVKWNAGFHGYQIAGSH
jgi:hypothetical protein